MTLPLLDPENGLACWVIGDVKDLNLAKMVWDSVGSKFNGLDSNGDISRFRLLGIVDDEIRDVEKVTRIWNSKVDKSGKATPKDRILIIAPEGSRPEIFVSNEEFGWNMFGGDQN